MTIINLFNIEIYRCLQPLMVSLSPCGTTKLIDHLCEDYDVEVHWWGDNLKENFGVGLHLAE